MSKSNLPLTLTGEAIEYQRLYNLTQTAGRSMTTTGAYTFTSVSSGTAYSTVSGGEYNVFLQLQTALANYLINETDYNGLATQASVTAVADDLASHVADYTTQIPFATTAGSANTYTVSTTPALTSLATGVAITVKINAGNTGASTLNWDGKGATAIKNPDGTALASGDLVLNGVYTLRYDGVNFILQGKGGVVLTGDAVVGNVLETKTFYSNDAKTKLTGTMPNRGTFNLGLGVSVPAGYYSGGTTTSGKRFASGTSTQPANPTSTSVTGLSFQPSFIVIDVTDGQHIYRKVFRQGAGVINKVTYRVRIFEDQQAGYIGNDWTITSNGFSVRVDQATAGASLSWYAVE